MSTTVKGETKPTIPEMTDEEKDLLGMISDALMPAALGEMGYESIKTTIPFEETEEYKDLVQQKENSLISSGMSQSFIDNAMATDDWGLIEDARTKYNKDPKTKHKIRKMGTPEEEASRTKLLNKGYTAEQIDSGSIKDANGEIIDADVQAYEDLKAKTSEDKTKMAKKKQEVEEKFIDVTLKYLSGDFTATEEQKKLVAENMAPIKAAVQEMYQKAREELDKTEEKMGEEISRTEGKIEGEISRTEGKIEGEISRTEKTLFDTANKTFDEYEKKLRETKLDVFSALDAVGDQILKTGKDMETSLTNVVATNKELLKMGIEDYTGQVTKNISTNAALLGRSPDDPEYSLEIQNQISRQIKSGQLDLASMEAQGMLSIKERTGTGLENLGLQKASVTAGTGEALAGAAMGRGQESSRIAETAGISRQNLFGQSGFARQNLLGQSGFAKQNLLGQMGQTRLGLIQGEGISDVGLEESAANLRWQIGAGMPPSQTSLGVGVGQYNQAVDQQRINNAMVAMNAPMGLYGTYAQERFAQPTTTSNQKTQMSRGLIAANFGMAGVEAAGNFFSGYMGGGGIGGGIREGIGGGL